MTRTELIRCLRDLGACDQALIWIEQTPGEPADLWAACQRGDWMIWLLATAGYDKRTMRHIACDCAEDVLHIYEQAHPDDSRPRNAISVARRYANGEATDDELNTAYYAARAAAKNAAWDAAWDAAWAAARTAIRDAACDAARDAAWDATWAAARDAARAASQNAARNAARNAAEAVAQAQTLDAARDPAWTVARDAAMSRHADMIRTRVSWEDVERAMAREK